MKFARIKIFVFRLPEELFRGKNDNCFENRSKRPKNWKKNTSEKGLTAAEDDSSTEFMLGTINYCKVNTIDDYSVCASTVEYGLAEHEGFDDNIDLLNDPNIFIADTGATCDSTPYDTGMKDLRQAGKGDDIVDASGQKITAQSVGNLIGTVCNKDGQEKFKVTMNDVVHMPNAKFNLFSISK